MEPISGYDTMLLIIAVLLMGLWFLIQEFKNAEYIKIAEDRIAKETLGDFL